MSEMRNRISINDFKYDCLSDLDCPNEINGHWRIIRGIS